MAAVENVAPSLLRARFSHTLVAPTMTGAEFVLVRRRPGDRRYTRAPVAYMAAGCSSAPCGIVHGGPIKQVGPT
jgi:hypothetical protein